MQLTKGDKLFLFRNNITTNIIFSSPMDENYIWVYGEKDDAQDIFCCKLEDCALDENGLTILKINRTKKLITKHKEEIRLLEAHLKSLEG